jgi:hypothetical protein
MRDNRFDCRRRRRCRHGNGWRFYRRFRNYRGNWRRFRDRWNNWDRLGRDRSRGRRMRKELLQLLFKVLSSDFVQRTGRHFGLGNAQLLGFDKDVLAFDAKLLR